MPASAPRPRARTRGVGSSCTRTGGTPATDPGSRSAELVAVLTEARRRGFLGPGPVGDHVEHAGAFLAPLRELLGDGRGRVVDLGAGGGVPALALALALPGTHWWLVESATRRADFLAEAVLRLGVADRVEVLAERAEDVGRAGERRGTADAVTARSFGPPAAVAECAAPLLRVGGGLVVSEPPGGAAERWPSDGLAQLGLGAVASRSGPPAVAVLVQQAPCPQRWPRRPGAPAKRPLW